MGDDACLILWDARTGTSPAVKVMLFSKANQQRFVQEIFYFNGVNNIMCRSLR